jgi:hypothetical protein
MEQQTYRINSTFDRMSLIHNVPVQFSINERRVIEFSFPTIRDSLGDIDFKTFLGVISLTPERIKEKDLKLNFIVKIHGDIIQGLIANDDYSKLLVPYLLKYIKNSEYKDKAIFVDDEKIMSYELDYIIDKILISIGQKNFEEEEKTNEEKLDPAIAKILQAQKESEEKLKKIKQKKSEGGLNIEQIMLAVTYEFRISSKDLLELNYFGVIWYFSYVGKVDAHKLNQMILSSGMSKQKSYNYWLNK